MAEMTRSEIIDTAKTLGLGLGLAFVLHVAVFQPFTIPSDSMEPLLVKGDYFVAWKPSYGWSRFSIPFAPPLFRGRIFERTPQRGDVVVFNHRKSDGPGRSDFIKRLIGLPGDRIQLQGGRLFINGAQVKRERLGPGTDPDDPSRVVTRYRETLPDGRSWITLNEGPDHEGETTDVYTVPEERFFFMGDNRDNSLDSRWPEGVGMGFVPKEELEGQASVILMSWRGGASLWEPWTWFTRLDVARAFRPIR
jgi:signal peptidase I